MKANENKCPSCGAPLEYDYKKLIAHCAYCNQDFEIDEREVDRRNREFVTKIAVEKRMNEENRRAGKYQMTDQDKKIMELLMNLFINGTGIMRTLKSVLTILMILLFLLLLLNFVR